MARIHQLPPHIVAKIAAGEVIERPAYAVKELVENAIDAGADDIVIYIEQAGLKKIMVSDNGEGMSEEDLANSWKPHTTSKISQEDNLIGIKSFGFRGEALASLAAVSHLTIKSRTKNSPIGHQVEIKDGKLIHTSPAGMPEGTVVIAENIFSSIPARKKFLKSTQTELRHIGEVIQYFSVSYPHIRFSLIHNKRLLLDLPKTTSHEERIRNLLGEEIFTQFIPLTHEDSYVTLSGFIAKPQLHSSSQSKQFLFVNKRKVSDRLISLAVKEAYGTMLESSSYPLFVLFITLPFEMVDVNVHPRKEQISFINNQLIFQTVKQAIMETLQNNNLSFQNLSWKRSGVGTTNSLAAQILRQTVLEKEVFQPEENSPLMQFHNLYIISQTKNGILYIDQHAAHERILFEKLKKEFINQKKKQNPLTLSQPLVLHISSSEQLLLSEHKKLLNTVGFQFQSSKATKQPQKENKTTTQRIVLTHIPWLFKDRDHKELIQEMLEDLSQEKGIKDIDTVSQEMLSFLACRAAVKAGDKLTEKLMEKLIKTLEQTPDNATCPHGRPTHIFIPLSTIHALFKRS